MAKDRGAGLGSRRAQGRWGVGERAGAHRRARRGRWAQQAGVQGARQAGRQACVDARAGGSGTDAAGARHGHLGWPWAVHSAYFRSVLTRFFF